MPIARDASFPISRSSTARFTPLGISAIGSNMAVFAFQIGDDGLLVHDFIQEDGWFFTNYIEAVKERGYTGKCYVPHDISVKSFESGRTRIKRSFPPKPDALRGGFDM